MTNRNAVFTRTAQLRLTFIATLLATLAIARGAAAQAAWQSAEGPAGASRADYKPEQLAEVKLEEKLGQQIPLDAAFVDETGTPVTLKKYFDAGKPVIVQLGYFGCPTLCAMVSHGLLDSLKEVSLQPGKDFQIVYISIDPQEKPTLAAEKKQSYLGDYARPGTETGWHFLTGRTEQIDRVANAVGFSYRYIPSAAQYAHPAGIIFAAPDGKISRYIGGVRFDPNTVRYSLVEASQGKVGTVMDQLFLTCFQFDGHQGRYAFTALYIMRAGGVIVMIIVGIVLTRMFLRERREAAAAERAKSAGPGGTPAVGH